MSYPTLKKVCQRADVPTPDRGHWAKVEAGKPVRWPALLARGPGMDPEVRVGGSPYRHHAWTHEELLGPLPLPLPLPPAFAEPIEVVRKRVAKAIGEVATPRSVRVWHTGLARLLADDEKRRTKQAASPYARALAARQSTAMGHGRGRHEA